MPKMLADHVKTLKTTRATSVVELSNELVPLLSEQLYRSPIKAIEELVVNSYDAGATQVRVFVPSPEEQQRPAGTKMVVVFDNGEGMDASALVDLWHVGRSPKKGSRVRNSRKQIGKFGIGKIASYAIAYRLTYVTRTPKDGILTSTLDFRNLTQSSPSSAGSVKRVEVPVYSIATLAELQSAPSFDTAVRVAAIPKDALDSESWTLAILEELRPKALEIKLGRLTWVLSTAMPLRADFALWLNNEAVGSSKLSKPALVDFKVVELRDEYIESGLNKQYSKSKWRKASGMLVSATFPNGIYGRIQMYEQTLIGKSDDLERSHGFFVRVRDRLVNLEDPLFGTTDLSYKYFARFVGDVNADDLDSAVKAAREGVDSSDLRSELVAVLRALFNDARSRYDKIIAEREKEKRKRTEDTRSSHDPTHLAWHFPM